VGAHDLPDKDAAKVVPSGLQVTVCQVPPGTSRWNTIGATTTRTGLSVTPSSTRAATRSAVLEVTPILDALHRRPRPAPITAPASADLANLIGRSATKNTK